MRGFLTGLAILMLAATTPARADFLAEQMAYVDEVAKAERDFAAETKEKGFHRGFIAWSTDDAIGFLPQAGNFHKTLSDALAADPSLAEKPTPLRWWPYYIGVDVAGELAYDLGPWKIEGTDQAGWFFTIWEKQPDGQWKWSLDGRAGKDTTANIPPDNTASRFWTGSADYRDGLEKDDAFNTRLATSPAVDVFSGWTLTAIASPNVPPFLPLSGKVADSARREAAIADRPSPGHTWSRDGHRASRHGDFLCTWGRVTASDGSYLGHYVRVWQKSGSGSDGWYPTVDLYQTP